MSYSLGRLTANGAPLLLGGVGQTGVTASHKDAARHDRTRDPRRVGERGGEKLAVRYHSSSDEEIIDVSLATFHVFEKENPVRPRVRSAGVTGTCGTGFYYNPPAYSGPAYPPPPVRPMNKYRHSPKRT